jgi:hypothetical protein
MPTFGAEVITQRGARSELLNTTFAAIHAAFVNLVKSNRKSEIVYASSTLHPSLLHEIMPM